MTGAVAHRPLPTGAATDQPGPGEHIAHIYPEDGELLDSITRFVSTGLAGGEGVVLIATPSHLAALDRALSAAGHDVALARREDRYLTLDAEASLARFVVNGWPDATLFEAFVAEALARARGAGRPVRAFGEMVTLLWSRGHYAATIRLEELWHRLCARDSFGLYCAYPRHVLSRGRAEAVREICSLHHRIVDTAAAAD